jgi:hypothetical protein
MPTPLPPSDRQQLHDLDELFARSTEYKSSANFLETLKFIVRMRNHSPYNGFLLRMQNPHLTWALTTARWQGLYGRTVKEDARPCIILVPFGPVSFVYDLVDTTGPALPPDVLEPFRSAGELPPHVWDNLLGNCRNNRIEIRPVALSIREAGSVTHARTEARHPLPDYTIEVSDRLSLENAFATVVHELAHVYCGHCGNAPGRDRYEDRPGLPQQVEEFEAESVSYLVCRRYGVRSESEAYLAGYVGEHDTIPPISINTVLKAARRIEHWCDTKPKDEHSSPPAGSGAEMQ